MFSAAQVLAAAVVSVGMDKIPSATETALRGIATNQHRLHAAAHEIATAPARGAGAVDLAEPLVEMIEAQRTIEAAAAVLKRTNDTLDSFLEAVHS